MFRKISVISFLLLSLVSCSTGRNMHKMSYGMGKDQVIDILGSPRSVGGGNNVEVFHYRDDNGFWNYDYYYVRLVDGKVESFGPESRSSPVTDSHPPIKK